MEIYFATSNKNKLREAKEIIGNSMELKQFEFKHNEIRSDSIEEIALEAVEKAYLKLQKPVFVEDSGLFIKSLNGFPGTYSAWVQKKIGNKGILDLLKEMGDRKAEFRCCVAYFDGKDRKTFLGSVKGGISTEIRGEGGFGYDPIFIPQGKELTFAQSIDLKKALSHRYNAIITLKSYILQRD